MSNNNQFKIFFIFLHLIFAGAMMYFSAPDILNYFENSTDYTPMIQLCVMEASYLLIPILLSTRRSPLPFGEEVQIAPYSLLLSDIGLVTMLIVYDQLFLPSTRSAILFIMSTEPVALVLSGEFIKFIFSVEASPVRSYLSSIERINLSSAIGQLFQNNPLPQQEQGIIPQNEVSNQLSDEKTPLLMPPLLLRALQPPPPHYNGEIYVEIDEEKANIEENANSSAGNQENEKNPSRHPTP